MKIRFTRDFIIKDLREKFDRNRLESIEVEFIKDNITSDIEVDYVNKSEIYDYLEIGPSNRPKDLNDKLESFSNTLFVVHDPINRFELKFLLDNVNLTTFVGNLPITFTGGLYSQVFYEGMFGKTLENESKVLDELTIYLIEDDYIFIKDCGQGTSIIILNTNENGEIIFPEFDDIELDLDPDYFIDSELIRKLKLQAMTGEAVL